MEEGYSNKKVELEEKKKLVPYAKGYICLRDCSVEGIGEFKEGMVVYESVIINRIKKDPNFEKIDEEDI